MKHCAKRIAVTWATFLKADSRGKWFFIAVATAAQVLRATLTATIRMRSGNSVHRIHAYLIGAVSTGLNHRKIRPQVLQTMAAAHRVWLRKWAPWAIRTPLKTTPSVDATLKAITANLGRRTTCAAKTKANSENPPAEWPAGKHRPALTGITNQALACAEKPPNCRESQGHGKGGGGLQNHDDQRSCSHGDESRQEKRPPGAKCLKPEGGKCEEEQHHPDQDDQGLAEVMPDQLECPLVAERKAPECLVKEESRQPKVDTAVSSCHSQRDKCTRKGVSEGQAPRKCNDGHGVFFSARCGPGHLSEPAIEVSSNGSR